MDNQPNSIVDKHVFNVVLAYAERAQKGFQKYGTTTERTDIDLLGWLQHLQEELMDATIYIERIKHEVKQQKQSAYPELYNRRAEDKPLPNQPY